MLYGDERENKLAERIIGCGIAVHRVLGPGVLEAAYESALCLVLEASRIRLFGRSGYHSITEANSFQNIDRISSSTT